MAITTAMTTSFKAELLAGGHCFNATVTPTASATSGATSVTAVSSMASVAVGMPVTGTGINVGGVGTVVAAITSGTALTLSVATTAAISGAAITIAGDVFKMALIKPSAAGTYNTLSTNYTNITGSSDEVTNASGTSYTATGQVLTNVSPVASSSAASVAYISFANPSWTTATFSTSGCMIYNASVRNGGTSGTNTTGGGRACSVHDFGGNQQVSSGTFTVLMPTADTTNAILRIAAFLFAAVVSTSSLLLPLIS